MRKFWISKLAGLKISGRSPSPVNSDHSTWARGAFGSRIRESLPGVLFMVWQCAHLGILSLKTGSSPKTGQSYSKHYTFLNSFVFQRWVMSLSTVRVSVPNIQGSIHHPHSTLQVKGSATTTLPLMVIIHPLVWQVLQLLKGHPLVFVISVSYHLCPHY